MEFDCEAIEAEIQRIIKQSFTGIELQRLRLVTRNKVFQSDWKKLKDLESKGLAQSDSHEIWLNKMLNRWGLTERVGYIDYADPPKDQDFRYEALQIRVDLTRSPKDIKAFLNEVVLSKILEQQKHFKKWNGQNEYRYIADNSYGVFEPTEDTNPEGNTNKYQKSNENYQVLIDTYDLHKRKGLSWNQTCNERGNSTVSTERNRIKRFQKLCKKGIPGFKAFPEAPLKFILPEDET